MPHGRGLEDVEHLSHVAVPDLHDGLGTVLAEVDALAACHVLQAPQDLLLQQWREPQLGTPGLQRGDDLAAVVADEDEAGVRSVLLNHAPQGKLRSLGHVVRLVEYHELGLPLSTARVEELLHADEGLDLIPHHVDAARVRGIHLQGHGLVLLPVHSLRERRDGGGLARAWGAMEEHVRQLLLGHHALDHAYDVLVRDQLPERRGPVFLHPGQLRSVGDRRRREAPALGIGGRRGRTRRVHHLHIRGRRCHRMCPLVTSTECADVGVSAAGHKTA
mmetsp:Transcript_59819/g.159100  ORF Transcript_59819/g.159100 Transcript_59819/m.159100 type:complete len:275 (+) Transcript_59819:568-1392(+)